MDRNLRKYTRNHLRNNHNSKKIRIPYFIKFIFYSIISAIIFLLVYSFFFAPEMIYNVGETIKEKIVYIGDVISKIPNSISVDENESNTNNQEDSNVRTITIQELTENLDEFLGNEITITGKGEITDVFCAIQTCCKNLDYSGSLYIEDKVTIPRSKYTIPIKAVAKGFTGDWKCKGELKKETFNRRECQYSNKIGDNMQFEKDNCELEPTIDCYYFDASFCECLSDYC